jgi:hypothetical protein
VGKSGDKATGTKNFIIGGGGGVKFKIPFFCVIARRTLVQCGNLYFFKL